MGALAWLKNHYPEQYRDYIRDLLMKSKSIRKNRAEKLIEERKPEPVEPIQEPEPKKRLPFLSMKAEKNQDLEIVKDAIKFCEDRMITKEMWSNFFVCKEDKYCNRMIIPFYNHERKIYFFIARSLYSNEPKYLGMEDAIKKPYNIYNVNREKPIVCLEGPLDSLFVENSIALSGLQFDPETEKYFEGMKIYYLLDSDESGQDKSYRLLKQGNHVFNWFKFKKDLHLPARDKWDINEVVLYLGKQGKFTFDELKKYFTNSFMDLIYFEERKKKFKKFLVYKKR